MTALAAMDDLGRLYGFCFLVGRCLLKGRQICVVAEESSQLERCLIASRSTIEFNCLVESVSSIAVRAMVSTSLSSSLREKVSVRSGAVTRLLRSVPLLLRSESWGTGLARVRSDTVW